MEELQAQLLSEKNREAAKKDALKQNQSTIAEKKKDVESNNKLLEQYIDGLEAEANRLTAIIIAMQSDEAYVGGDFLWPVPGYKKVTSEFGERVHPILKTKKLHTGMDIGAPSGTNVVAANAGRVMKAGWNDSYGYLVMIDHGGGIVTLYAHNSSLLVSDGDIVTRGQVISKVGSTGMSTGPHLHFEVRINGEYQDPRGRL
jgi:murein DD-endopeptidase MepM/ murein hydrolase activator NlpD